MSNTGCGCIGILLARASSLNTVARGYSRIFDRAAAHHPGGRARNIRERALSSSLSSCGEGAAKCNYNEAPVRRLCPSSWPSALLCVDRPFSARIADPSYSHSSSLGFSIRQKCYQARHSARIFRQQPESALGPSRSDFSPLCLGVSRH